MKRIIGVLVLIISLHTSLQAQHQEISEKPEMYKGKKEQPSDTTTLLSAFKRGHVNGHFRYFFMTTNNQPGLTDYYANAAGGGIRFETANFHGFQFAVSGFYTFNIGSSDLGKPDSATGQYNRYEIGLFDQLDPYNKKDIDRLEEFYLKYNYKKSSISFGKLLLNTPFINLQDGRMRPTGAEGVWLELNEIKKTKIEGGWIYAISPRGTTKWFNTGESIGIYPAGLNPDGSKSQYQSNIENSGVALLGITHTLHPNLKLQGWDMYTENVFNSAMLQTDFQLPQKKGSTVFASAQLIQQIALNDGGNSDPAKSYFQKGSKALTFGAKAGWKNKIWEASFNYNRITAKGRYLVPREWGRDPFFTFLPRERNEGYGDVNAVVAKVNYQVSKARVKTSLAVGYVDLPDVKNYMLNKYGMPSYIQLNADIRYAFAGIMKGLEAQLLVAGKINNAETYQNPRYEFNKVDMVQYNFVLNYYF